MDKKPGRPKTMEDTVSLRLIIPSSWKKQLMLMSHKKSIDEEKNISVLNLIRSAIKDKYNLKG